MADEKDLNTVNDYGEEKKVKPKWTIVELKRFDRIILQISAHDPEYDEYRIIGTITLDDTDMESREAWTKAIDMMNREFSQKSS